MQSPGNPHHGLATSRSFRILFGAFLLAWLVIAGAAAALAQAQPTGSSSSEKIKVATRVIAPFVIKQGDRFDGFSIELWRALAGVMGRPYEIIEKGPLQELIETLEKREADLAIAAISITAAREERFDFSQPMFDSGLQIMVKAQGDGFGLSRIWQMLTTGAMPIFLAILAALIIVPAHIVWLAERRHPDAIVSTSYFPGIFHALWWATGAAQGQQLDHPRSAIGKTISALAVFVSVIFIAFFTANITSSMTVAQLKSDINGPEDLPGRKVATVTGSTSANIVRAHNGIVVDRPAIRDAIQVLLDGQADAVVFDAPVLLYFASNEGKGRVAMAGQMFRKEAYGILFPQDSPMRKPVNEALLKLREDGTYDRIYNKWFQARDKD